MTKKVHKLKEVTPDDFSIIAIASHENHYRLTWVLNEALQFDFRKAEDLEIQEKDQSIRQFNRYRYKDETQALVFDLISNQSENGFLFKDLKNIDFFLKAAGDIENFNLTYFINELKKIKHVITAFEINDLSRMNLKKLTY